jgi:hypothetical protein
MDMLAPMLRMQNFGHEALHGGANFERIYSELGQLEALYPSFHAWYWDKVVPDTMSGNRKIFISLTQEKISGIVIAKRTQSERKLCTIWTPRSFRHSGVATRILRNAIDWLGSERPLISIPEDRISEFRPLVTRWNFSCTQVLRSYYRPGMIEFVFNGCLSTACRDSKIDAINFRARQ